MAATGCVRHAEPVTKIGKQPCAEEPGGGARLATIACGAIVVAVVLCAFQIESIVRRALVDLVSIVITISVLGAIALLARPRQNR